MDTNIVLLALAQPERLSRAARVAIRAGPNVISVISYWEVALKSAKGRLEVGELKAWWTNALRDFAATALPLRPVHMDEICGLPPIHQDPFDRALIAQATVEDLVVVTTDEILPRYASERTRVIR